jgi:hypothetical protein
MPLCDLQINRQRVEALVLKSWFQSLGLQSLGLQSLGLQSLGLPATASPAMSKRSKCQGKAIISG